MVSDSFFTWMAGTAPQPRPPRPRSRSPRRELKATVRVDLSDTEFSSTSSDDNTSKVKKVVRFKEDERKSAMKKDVAKGKIEAKPKEDSGKEASDSADSQCSRCCREIKARKSDKQNAKGDTQKGKSNKAEHQHQQGKHQKQNKQNNQPQQSQNNGKQQNQQNQQNRDQSSNQNQRPQGNWNNQNNSNNTNRANPVAQNNRRPSQYSSLPINMVGRVIKPSRADVVLREDVVEGPTDPRPNAFFDPKTGVLRVYHGPVYGKNNSRGKKHSESRGLMCNYRLRCILPRHRHCQGSKADCLFVHETLSQVHLYL